MNGCNSKQNKFNSAMTTKATILTIICYLNLSYARPQQYRGSLESFWKDAEPGELLRSLDIITSTTHHLTQPIRKEKVNSKSDLPNKDETNKLLKRIDEGSVESLEEKATYDYDKTYEEFVKKYFGDSLTDASVSTQNAENAENYHQAAYASSGEEIIDDEEQEPISEATKQSGNKCKNITRGKQNCFICKNSRNGETSESCSYDQETKPQSYEFGKQKNYRKYLTTPKKSPDEKSTNQHSAPRTNNSMKTSIKRTPIKLNDTTSSCILEKVNNKMCYFCENSMGEKATKCYTDEIPISSSANEQASASKKKIQKSKQRIYKRTISINHTCDLEQPFPSSLSA